MATQNVRARADVVTGLYEREAEAVKRLVAGRARVPEAVLEDACQAAWERLWRNPEVGLQRDVAMRWLVVTATRQAWREYRHELPVGVWPEDASPTREAPGPLEVVIERERAQAVAVRLRSLTPRERRFLGLRAAGLSYREIAALTGATVRTVERQVLRGRRKLLDRPSDDAR